MRYVKRVKYLPRCNNAPSFAQKKKKKNNNIARKTNIYGNQIDFNYENLKTVS